MNTNQHTETNELFPVFFKLNQLRILIVGGGYVGMEKLEAVLSNSPRALVKLVAITISYEIKQLAVSYPNLTLVEKPYDSSVFEDVDIAIVAINEPLISSEIARDARIKKILVNVADKPALCDFYLGSVVKKGNLKIAISTNGQSPTIAKRLKEVLNDAIPDEMNSLLDNMKNIRSKIKGDFAEKVRQLNEITKELSIK